MKKKEYEYIVLGAGITGCSIAYELQKSTNSILLIDKHSDVAQGASGVAGGFLSPLLGKPNNFKDLITEALKYSTKFYKANVPQYIDQCGTVRIPKNQEDEKRFKSYKNFMDFEYTKKDNGYFFDYASVVDGYNVCKSLVQNIEKKFNCEINSIRYKNNLWYIDNKYITKKLILATGANTKLIDEKYINIRAVWGQRVVIETTTKTDINYHKECSISRGVLNNNKTFTVSIGATHHRLDDNTKHLCTQCSNICIRKEDTNFLLKKSANILKLENIKIVQELAGARACSVDYFPIVGKLINSSKTLEEFPYLVNGTNVQDDRFTYIDNLYIINGVGGRGYVLAPYLAKILFNHIINDDKIYGILTPNRLFKRWVKKYKNKDKVNG